MIAKKKMKQIRMFVAGTREGFGVIVPAVGGLLPDPLYYKSFVPGASSHKAELIAAGRVCFELHKRGLKNHKVTVVTNNKVVRRDFNKSWWDWDWDNKDWDDTQHVTQLMRFFKQVKKFAGLYVVRDNKKNGSDHLAVAARLARKSVKDGKRGGIEPKKLIEVRPEDVERMMSAPKVRSRALTPS